MLSKTYDNKGITRKVSIIKELVNKKYPDCRDMSDYLHKVISAYQQLKSTDEELIAGIILTNLPEKYEPLIMAIINQ